jgi:N-methylhydantoinase A
MMEYRIGIDVGGTFTDFLVMDDDGGTGIYKILSSPDDPSRAVMQGLARMAADRGLGLAAFLGRVTTVVHGTTVTTNAVLTGNCAATGLVTTRGFRDALAMRRGIREVLYDNKYRAPRPLVPRRLRLGVAERIDHRGEVLQPVAADDVEHAIDRLIAAGVEAVAVCFMHAYANPAHEAAAAARIKARMPGAYLSVSSEVLPQMRFYDRVSTTVLNAAVGPILKRYIDALTRRLDAAGFAGVLLIMQSNGGVTTPAAVTALAASTLLSGPAAAPMAGLAYAALHDQKNFITIDMGGTSFDAALVRDGAPGVTLAARIERMALGLPTMEIATIGAGGGSIGWIDEGGLLRMGPQSAGAHPGPACYGSGGEAPSCTDANLVLGYLDADHFAGGAMKLDAAAATRAIEQHIAGPLGLTTVAAAWGMCRVMNVNMASAIREISVQKGYDPREFLLVSAGGAGPLHAAMIAAELEIPRLLVPRDSSIFCAAGMLRSDLKHDIVRSCHTSLGDGAIDLARITGLLAEMAAEADAALARDGIAASRRRRRYSFDLRYPGQYHEVNVAVEEGIAVPFDAPAAAAAFHAAHDRLYGYSLADAGTGIELVNLRLTAIGATDKPPLVAAPRRDPDPGAAHKGTRPVFLPDQRNFAPVDVYDGALLGHGNRLVGPAIVEHVNTTLVVPAGVAVACDAYGSYLLTTAG